MEEESKGNIYINSVLYATDRVLTTSILSKQSGKNSYHIDDNHQPIKVEDSSFTLLHNDSTNIDTLLIEIRNLSASDTILLVNQTEGKLIEELIGNDSTHTICQKIVVNNENFQNPEKIKDYTFRLSPKNRLCTWIHEDKITEKNVTPTQKTSSNFQLIIEWIKSHLAILLLSFTVICLLITTIVYIYLYYHKRAISVDNNDNYSSETDELQKKITDLQATNQNLEQENKQLKTDKESLTDAIATTNDEMNKLKKKVEKFDTEKQKRWSRRFTSDIPL